MSVLHPVRSFLIRERVKTTNQRHALLLEFGISLPRGSVVIIRLSAVLEENNIPPYLERLLTRLHAYDGYLSELIKEIDNELKTLLDEDETV